MSKHDPPIWRNRCKVCGKRRVYTTKQGWQKGGNLPCNSCRNSLSAGGPGKVYSASGKTKRCSSCHKFKRLASYRKNSKGIYSQCIPCHLESSRKRNKDFRYDQYGITQEDYARLCSEQNNACFLCGKTGITLCIDHNHTTGAIRKLLCRSCNSVLGLVNENSVVLGKMITYLEQHA